MYQAGTLSGHPLTMAAGIATLDELTPDAYLALEARARAGGRPAGRRGAGGCARLRLARRLAADRLLPR